MIIRNELGQEFCNNMFNKYSKKKYSFYWKSDMSKSQFHWHKNLFDNKNETDLTDEFLASNYEDEKKIWEVLKKYTSQDIRLKRLYVNAYTHGTDALTHKDSKALDEYTAIFYITKKWHPDWAGETVVFDSTNKIIMAELPEKDKLIFFKGRDLHGARPISKICNDLRMVLVFKFQWTLPLQINPTVLEFFNSLDLSVIHTEGRTLKEHLLGTYSILKDEGNIDDVCYAGLFHSISGTSIFKTQTLENIDILKNYISQESIDLINLFSKLDRPNCWTINNYKLPLTDGSIVEVTKKQYNSLKLIEQANLREQNK